MSDQPTPITPTPITPPSTQSLDEILNQLEKTTGTAPVSAGTPTPPQMPVPTDTVVPEPMPTETVAVPEAPAPMPEPVAVVPEITPEPEVTPEVPQPVATIPENTVTPTTPTPEPTPAAPMVQEEPALDTAKSSPIPEAETSVAVESAPAAPAPTPVKGSGSGNKIVVGIIGVLMLAGVAAVGVYASKMQQNTVSDAYASPAPDQTQSPDQTAAVYTPVPSQAPLSTNFSGKACLNKTEGPGNVFVYNLTKKVFTRVPMVAGQETFIATIPAGESVAYYKTSDGAKSAGYTDESHKLKKFSSIGTAADVTIDVCDIALDTTTIPPQTEYQPYQP